MHSTTNPLLILLVCLATVAAGGLFGCSPKSDVPQTDENPAATDSLRTDTLFVGTLGASIEDVVGIYVTDTLSRQTPYCFLTLQPEPAASADTSAWIYIFDTPEQQAHVAHLRRDSLHAKPWFVAEAVETDSVPPTLDFYLRFATDEAFTRRHLAAVIHFSTYDDDAYEQMDGVFVREQWPDFAPALPSEHIVFLYAGDRGGFDLDASTGAPSAKAEATTATLRIDAPQEGLSSTLHFERQRRNWVLTKLEN